MSSVLKKLNPVSTVALCVALLALIASAAGVGYAAGQIGTNGIKNNAITTKKIKNNAIKTKKIKNNAVSSAKIKSNAVTGDKVLDGSLTAADLVADEKQIAAVFGNGGEGDCTWQNASVLVPGLVNMTYRKDRFNTVHLTGYALASNGVGGDGVCDPSDPGQVADGIVFTLPASHMPAKTLIALGDGDGIVVAGPQGVTLPGTILPPGAVYTTTGLALLEGVTYEAVGSGVVIAKTQASGRATGGLLTLLGSS